MKKFNSLIDILIEEMTDLLNAESQMIEALPKMSKASQSTVLKSTLNDFLELSREHFKRLQEIFSNIGQRPLGVDCKAVKDIIADGADGINFIEKGRARDAVIIRVVQQVKQYEISGYKTSGEHAADLGHTMIVELLNKTLEEKRGMSFILNEIAQKMINIQAIDPKGQDQVTEMRKEAFSKDKAGGFYIPDQKYKGGRIKKRVKTTDVSRFIDEGNPNIQEPEEKKEKKEEQNLQNPEEQGDLS